MRGHPQKDTHRQLREEMHRAHARITEIARGLDPEQLLRRPAPDKWSVGHVLEHLLLMDAIFLRPVEPLIRTTRHDAAAPARPWRPSFIGGAIAKSLTKPAPLKALKARPATPRPAVVERFAEDAARFEALLEDSASLDWNAVRLRPPVLPWLPLKINLGDVFRIHTVHVQRHLGQIERVVGVR